MIMIITTYNNDNNADYDANNNNNILYNNNNMIIIIHNPCSIQKERTNAYELVCKLQPNGANAPQHIPEDGSHCLRLSTPPTQLYICY